MNLSKPRRITDRRYVKWIKQKPCLLVAPNGLADIPCLGPIDPHHVIKRSQGGSDYTCIPLCRGHHNHAEAHPLWNLGLFKWAFADFNEQCRTSPEQLGVKPERRKAMKAKLHIIGCQACGHAHEIPVHKASFLRNRNIEFRCVNKNEVVTVTL